MPFDSLRDDEYTKEALNKEIIKKLLSYLKPYKLEVLLTLFLMGFVIVTDLLNPYFLKLAIDKYIVGKNIAGLFQLGHDGC